MQRQGLYYNLVTSQSEGKVTVKDPREDDSRAGKSLEQNMSRLSSGKRKTSVVGKEQEEEEEEELKPDMLRLWKMNLPELPFLLLGFFGSAIVGGIQPAFAIAFAEILLGEFHDQGDNVEKYYYRLIVT
jgi:hypothetical protein